MEEYNGGCYHNALWQVVGGNIEATYDDYGRYKPVDIEYANFVTSAFQKDITKFEGRFYVTEEEIFYQISDEASDDRLRILDDYQSHEKERAELGIAIVAIHEKIFNHLLADDFLENISNAYSGMKRKDVLERYLGVINLATKGDLLRASGIRGMLDPIYDIDAVLTLAETDKEKAKKYAELLSEIDLLSSRMNLMRFQWHPVSHHGSQCTEFKVMKSFMEKAIEIADEQIYGDYAWLYEERD